MLRFPKAQYALMQDGFSEAEVKRVKSILEQVRPETAAMIEARATASGLSIDEYLKRLLGMSDGRQKVAACGLDELMTAMEALAEENIEPLPRNFSREDIYFPKA